MSKVINFNVLLSVDGKKQLVEAKANAEELRKKFDSTGKSLQKFTKRFLHFNEGLEAVRNLSEGVRQLGDSLRATADRSSMLTQLTGETGAGMRDLRKEIEAVADYFGKDFNEVLRSANALSKGFGISAQEAMRLVRDGLVSGADAGGDFLDTVREYPRYFKEAGLSAEDFIAISTNAAKQGVFSDKGVDAIKEGNLRIREMTTATAAALEGIGISSQAVMEGLRNGSVTTFDVMQQVAARLKELPPSASQVGAALADIFGGPGEDAGLELTQGQAEALVDFVFNLGIGALKRSTLLKFIRGGYATEHIQAEFRRWVYAGGEVQKGLVKRREWEAASWAGSPRSERAQAPQTNFT